MKKYQMCVRLSYYAYVEVDALDEFGAKDQGIRQAWREMREGGTNWGEEPEISELTEGEVQ